MNLIKRAFLALVLIAGFGPAFAQAPAPVPALPDTERRTTYSISGTTCACNVNFAIYGDAADYQNWVEVWLNGNNVPYNDAGAGWTITSPSGLLANLARPISNAVLTFNSPQTGTVQIVGARRPRRTSQVSENRGVSARDFNQTITDIIAQNRETWDRTNDITGRALRTTPGTLLGALPPPASCAGQFLAFDGTGLNPLCMQVVSSGSLAVPGTTIPSGVVCWNSPTGHTLGDCGGGAGLTGFLYSNGASGVTALSPLVVANNAAGADIGAKVNAAIASLGPSGGTVVIQPGTYSSIATGIVISGGRINLVGNGATLNFNTGVTGLLCSGVAASFSTVSDLHLIGADIVLGTNDGFAIQCPFFTASHIQVEAFGRDGVSILSTPAIGGSVFADNWHLVQVLSRNSLRDGIHVDGSDSNNGICDACEAQGFARNGFFDNSFIGVVYNSPNADNLSLGGAGTAGFVLSGSSITVNGGYCEKSTNTATLTGSSNTFSNSGTAPCVVSSSGGASFTNIIRRYDVAGFPAWSNFGINVANSSVSAAPRTYGFQVNEASGNFQMVDRTTGLPIWLYDQTLTTTQIQNKLTVLGIVVNSGMPTSCAGQPSGTLRNNASVVNICP